MGSVRQADTKYEKYLYSQWVKVIAKAKEVNELAKAHGITIKIVNK